MILCGKKLFPPLIRWAGYSLANHFLHLVCSVHFNSRVLWVSSWAFLLVLLSVVLWDFARGLVYLVVGGGRHVGPLAGLDLIWVALATAVRCRWGVLVLIVVLNCTRTRGGSPRSCRCLELYSHSRWVSSFLEFSNRLPLALAGLSLSLTSVVVFLVISISILIGQPVKCCIRLQQVEY